FDFVLCEQRFECGEPGGQELLDELHRSRLLPFWTSFIMITGEATAAKVSVAAESSLDGYLVKPATTAALGDRLTQARRRKQSLKDIFLAIEAGKLEHAALLCLKRFTDRGEYWLYAGRIGAEVLLRLGQPQQARKFFEAIRNAQQVPWGHLGIARAEVEAGSAHQAKRTLENLIADNPGYADAYDLLGRMHIDQGDFVNALATYRSASALTPRSLTRLQKQGTLAYYSGELAEAEQVLDRAVALDNHNRMFDMQTLVMLALLKFERGDQVGLHKVHARLRAVLTRYPDSLRLQRLNSVANLLRMAGGSDLEAVRAELTTWGGQLRAEDFDVEAASNLIALLAQLRPHGVMPDQTPAWGRTLGLRFCVSNSATELLCAAGRGHTPLQDALRVAHDEINACCERNLDLSLNGQPGDAVKNLLLQGSETLNARVIDLTGKLLQRHGDKLSDKDTLMAEAQSLRKRYCAQGGRLTLTERGREAGALSLNF
ncbi:MAG: hypothetical protein RL375_4378, partial [Pseudomonadota bacterium]